jgi:hypothetical protein
MKRRPFRRVSETRDYRPVFIIATEGKKTEPAYFRMGIFKSRERPVRVKVLRRGGGSSPEAVLEGMREYLKGYQKKKKGDEAWLVVDKDQWKGEELELLHVWSLSDSNRHLAVSNPQFEYWLLLHFEDGRNVSNKSECLRRLKKHIPDYDKARLHEGKFTVTRVRRATKRGKLQDSPPCRKWPDGTGTTVYRITERILK